MLLHFATVATLLLAVSHVTADSIFDKWLTSNDPDQKRTFEELIISRGYSLQAYTVRTDDGYILTLHRVVTQDYASENYTKTRKPVIVQHGLLGSASNFFINSPFLTREDNTTACGDNLGFCLLLTGRYDVWLPNSRGNGYSDGHDGGLSTSDRKYWEFTFDQMAVYDTPAVIDFVRKVTGYEKVGFIGYSQGSDIAFAMLSLKPEYAKVIQPYIAWAPPVYVGEMTSALRFLYPIVPGLKLAGGKFVFSAEISAKLTEAACGVAGVVCEGFLNAVMGKSTSLNETRLPVYFHFFPSTVSNWQMVHFAQLYKTGQFIRFDYGLVRNVKEYGQPRPPLYPLENIPEGFTIGIIRGNTDAYVAQEDAEKLIDVLKKGNVNVDDYVVPKKEWSHLDFIIGMDSGRLVNDRTVELLDKYTA